MKFYLSSYKLGSEENIEKFRHMLEGHNKRCAFISNALDFSTDVERRTQSETEGIKSLNELGLVVEKLDLRVFFGKKKELESKLKDFGVIWVIGGNCFVLRQAMKLSGFDEILLDLYRRNTELIYGGFSAGVCVLCPTLNGYTIVDDPTAKPYGDDVPTVWEGLGILNYIVEPHYRSDHPESQLIEKEVEKLIKEKVPYVALRDGEVIIT